MPRSTFQNRPAPLLAAHRSFSPSHPTSPIATTRAAPISPRTDMPLLSWMSVAAEIQAASSSRSQTKREMATTSWNGSQNNHFVTAKLRYGAVLTPGSINGQRPRNFQRVVTHPMVDGYYDAMVPTRDQFARITFPILTITGQYDGDELGALTYYRDHLAAASAGTKTKHFLIIGPWDHAGTRTPTDEAAGVKFGGAAVIDLNDLHLQG